MRCLVLILLLLVTVLPLLAQSGLPLSFKGQPDLAQGISIENNALFYKDPTEDTLQPFSVIEQQRFVSASFISALKHQSDRQMKRTAQVIWVQFKVANTHPTDTLRLWYAGDLHALFSLYQKNKDTVRLIGSSGFWNSLDSFPVKTRALPLTIPPQTTGHYYVRVVDYILQLGDIAGKLHTRQSLEWATAQSILEEQWLFGAMAMMLGCLILMSCYALFQYFLNRDSAFLYYTLYAVSAGCLLLELANARFSLGLDPASIPMLGHPVAFSFLHVISIMYALFLTKLLAIPQHQPLLWRVIQILMVCLALLQLMVILQLFTGLWIANSTLFFLVDTLPSLLMGVLLIIATLRSHSQLKPYLLTGEFSLYLVGISPFHGVFFSYESIS